MNFHAYAILVIAKFRMFRRDLEIIGIKHIPDPTETKKSPFLNTGRKTTETSM